MNSPSAQEHRKSAPKQLAFAVLTISDTRTLDTDHSGKWIVEQMVASGHVMLDHRIVADEPTEIIGAVAKLSIATNLDVIIATGGTGISPRDQTPEAIEPLLDVALPGFGEIFRMLSYQEIGPAAMLSRALAGRIGRVLVFCLPGSLNAVKLAMDKLLIPELPHLVHHSRSP